MSGILGPHLVLKYYTGKESEGETFVSMELRLWRDPIKVGQ